MNKQEKIQELKKEIKFITDIIEDYSNIDNHYLSIKELFQIQGTFASIYRKISDLNNENKMSL